MSDRVGLDPRGELNEWFSDEIDSVHIERMSSRVFWIGINLSNGVTIHLNTGVEKEKWFFRLEADSEDGEHFLVEKSATYGRRE